MEDVLFWLVCICLGVAFLNTILLLGIARFLIGFVDAVRRSTPPVNTEEEDSGLVDVETPQVGYDSRFSQPKE